MTNNKPGVGVKKLLLVISAFILVLTLLSFVSGLSSTVTISNTPIGSVRSDFYGVDDHYGFLTTARTIDINNNNGLAGTSNMTWHREAFVNSQMQTIRVVYQLDSGYKAVTNWNGWNGINFTGNATNRANEVQWASQNGYRIILRLDQTPKWLADNTTTYCTNGSTACPPMNYTMWNNIILHQINLTTMGGLYNSSVSLEIGNEPYGSGWLNSLGTDDIRKVIYYNQLYNSTYWAVKAVYPNMPIGNGAGTSTAPNFTAGFLSNNSQQMQFYADDEYNTPNDFNNLTRDILANCTKYNANCSNIIYTEWNNGDITVKNVSSRWQENAKLVSQGYTTALNGYPSRLTMVFYTWSDPWFYGQYSSEYPQLWNMLSEPTLNNTYYAGYNITKLFASNHKSGNTIKTSSSTESSLKVVASNDSTRTYITLTNTNASAVNVSIPFSLGLINVATNVSYSRETGSVELLNLAPNSVTTFVTPYPCTEGYEIDIEGLTCLQTSNAQMCEDSYQAFVDGVAILGLLLTVVLVGGAMAVLFMSFTGKLSFKDITSNLTLSDVLTGVIITGLTMLVAVTMVFLLAGSFC